jgi:glycosyltransferase involved in cell wall biosynthesis
MWVAPSPLLQSSFSVVSSELLNRLEGYNILYLGQNYYGEPRQMRNYVLASYSTGEHLIHYLDVFRPEITILFQSPPYLSQFSSLTKIIKEKSRLVLYVPIESTPIGVAVKQLFDEADLILVPSKWSKECLRKHDDMLYCEVLYHAVDTSIFKPSPKPENFTIGSIASHVWRKQLTRIMDAHKLAYDKNFKMHLLMIVSTYDMAPWMPDLGLYADQTKVNDVYFNEAARLNLAINQKEIASIYNQMHCHILTSTEAFGLPNLEAMASGTVPIIINHGASPEIVADCGIYARVSDYLDTVIGKIALVDIQDLAEKIVWAYQHPEALKQLAQKGIERAKLFRWEDATSKLQSLLEA